MYRTFFALTMVLLLPVIVAAACGNIPSGRKHAGTAAAAFVCASVLCRSELCFYGVYWTVVRSLSLLARVVCAICEHQPDGLVQN